MILNKTYKTQILIIVLSLVTFLSTAQDSSKTYVRKMIDIGDINMEYMDFGGDGIPLIWVQDFHTYLGEKYTEKQQFFKQFTSEFRVLAPIKRHTEKLIRLNLDMTLILKRMIS